MKVAVLGGGRSSEHEVSLASATAIREGLDRAGHQAFLIEVGRDGAWRRDGRPLTVTPGGGLEDVEVVFPALHGPFGEDGVVQGMLECLGVPYVGSGVAASAVCLDKVLFKELMAGAGLPQVRYRALRAPDWREDPDGCLHVVAELGRPVFVKPSHQGSSVGIARVDGGEDLKAAVDAAFEHDPSVIVEAAATGVEVECSVLGSAEAPEASEPGEIVLARGWYDFAAKYEPGGMELVVPARVSAAARARVRELATEAFVRAGCSGLARVDFFVDGEEVMVNELNTMPGFTATSVYAKLWEASGIPYPDLVDRLVGIAVARHRAEAAFRY